MNGSVTGQHIERAEGQLTFGMEVAADRTVDSPMLYDRADAEPGMVDRYVGHLMMLALKGGPSLKLKHRPAFATVIRHAFLVGVMAGRAAERERVQV